MNDHCRSREAILERPRHLVARPSNQRLGSNYNPHAERVTDQPIFVTSAEHSQWKCEISCRRRRRETQPASNSVVADVNHHIDPVAVDDVHRDLAFRIPDSRIRDFRVAGETRGGNADCKNAGSTEQHSSIVARESPPEHI